MYVINEWQPKFATKLICGHTVLAGKKAYRLMIAVCQEDVACLPQAIKAAIQAQQEQVQQTKPSLLYRLWHWCFGARRKKMRQAPDARPQGDSSADREWKRMPQVKRYTAKQGLHLDCGHSIQAGETLVVTSVCTCEQEAGWPLTILLGCLQVLQPQQTVKQPVVRPKPPLRRTLYTNEEQSQPHA